jgi:predicted O-methyltransferase YrrM
MDNRVAKLLDEMHRAGAAHDARTANRGDRFRNLEPASGALLGVLVRAARAQAVLELGTSNGYSTIWLADALRTTGGHLTSVDIDAGRSALAAENLRQAGLCGIVDLRVADAADLLRQASDGAYDLVFLDAERPAYASYWPDLLKVLRPHGLLAVDNVLSHAADIGDFRALVDATDSVTQALAPTGAGLLLVVKG